MTSYTALTHKWTRANERRVNVDDVNFAICRDTPTFLGGGGRPRMTKMGEMKGGEVVPLPPGAVVH